MSATAEYNLEEIIIALLTTSTALTQQIVHKDDDDAAAKDRIIVTVEPKMPGITAYRQTEKPPSWQATAHIEIRQATRNVAALETYSQAVDAAMQAAAPSGSVVTLASGLFPNGPVTINQSEEGGRHGDEVEVRQRNRTYLIRWPSQTGD